MTLFAEYNSPYLFAIAFVFFIGVLEMISLILATFFQARSTPISIIMTPCHPALRAGRFII